MQNKPRLCFVGPMLGSNPGWVTSQGEILAKLFQDNGYKVRLTSSKPNRILRLIDTITSLLSWQKDIDIIVLMVFSGPAFIMADISSWLAKQMRKPLVLWLHGGDLPEYSNQHPHWAKRVLCRGDVITSPSGYLANYFGEKGFNVKIIPNVLDIENYPFTLRTSTRKPKLLWMRTFHDLYHPEMAVKVLGELQKKYPDATLTMAGQDKGLLTPVKELAKTEGLEKHVRFAGFLDMKGKQMEFAGHDFFLNTNRVDNMPVSVVEAAAFGLPIIATAVGGIPHLLKDEKTALLVENGDVKGMTDAVCRLLSNKDLYQKLSENGRKLAESCSWPQVRPKWESIFKGLVSKPH